MIISTSSHNVPVNEELIQFVEASVGASFARIADRIRSVDVRLEVVNIDDELTTTKVMVRADLDSGKYFETERMDDDLPTAIRRGARATARSAVSYLTRSLAPNHGVRRRLRASFDSYRTVNA